MCCFGYTVLIKSDLLEGMSSVALIITAHEPDYHMTSLLFS